MHLLCVSSRKVFNRKCHYIITDSSTLGLFWTLNWGNLDQRGRHTYDPDDPRTHRFPPRGGGAAHRLPVLRGANCRLSCD